MFIEGYFKDCGVHNPVQYWQVRELNSTMMGATFPKMEHKFPKIIPKINVENMVYKEGVLSHVEDHNALFDCYKQIYKLFTVLKEYKQCQQFEIQS
jgi:hypothetical protein